MAKYGEGTNYAKATDPKSDNILDPGIFSGKVRVMQDTAVISASANLNSTDYIVVGGKLPTGSQVVKIIVGAPGTTSLGSMNNIVVGDEGDADRYLTTMQVSSANLQVAPDLATGMNYQVTGVTDNYIRITGKDTHARVSTNSIKVTIFYIVE